MRVARLGATTALLAASCAPAGAPGDDPFRPAYGGVETRLLDDDLVELRVTMEGARDDRDVIAFADCAAAQYARIRGFGFARHVRTRVSERGGVWRGDAVYTVSPDLPRGLRTIDAEVALDDCRRRGIPTV